MPVSTSSSFIEAASRVDASRILRDLKTAPRPPLPTTSAATGAAAGKAAGLGVAAKGAAVVAAAGAGFAIGEAAVRPALGIEYPGGGGLMDYLNRGKEEDRNPANTGVFEPAPDIPKAPFTGGQSPNVRYNFQFRTVFSFGQVSNWGNLSGDGPISIRYFTLSGGNPGAAIVEETGLIGERNLTSSSTSAGNSLRIEIRNMVRADGQPDTGGNPTPENAPINAPQKGRQSNGFPGLSPYGASSPTIVRPPQRTLPAESPVETPVDSPSAPGIPFLPVPGKANSPNSIGNVPQRPPNRGRSLPPDLSPNSAGVRSPKRPAVPTQQFQPEKIKEKRYGAPPDSKCPCSKGTNAKLDDILGRLGDNGIVPAVGDAGILAKLQQMDSFAKKAWETTGLQKAVNVLTLLSALHNAYYLSQDVALTFGEFVSLGLDVVGIEKEDGSPIDVNQAVGNAISNMLNNALGEQLVTDISNTLTRANRIYQSGANIMWTLRNIQDTTADAIEMSANNTGKIGNALKRSGVVDALSYQWMSENVQVRDQYRAKVNRWYEGIEGVEDRFSTLYGVTSNVREIQEEFDYLGDARADFAQNIADAIPKEIPDNTPIQDDFNDSKVASESPDLTDVNTEPAE
ncbi:hypothetical protein [Sphaerothrix gracilis]|uniref:hypothetical protein n=1 Tax=Sphaerothrix gracilis TaxID=3151835 RepID=UPI0031FDC69F